ncbi:hypothetical protein ANO14919_051210 [Xylariales sp. No.14919]|nr:hypothetical protein ANO14919_051210 [Xylariales sp. No.14919]
MCKIISNVTYGCSHIEPWVEPRACQYGAEGARKPPQKDPLCLIYPHCRRLGNVRQINIFDQMLCSACYIAQTQKRKNISAQVKEKIVSKAEKKAGFHAKCARKHIADSEKDSRLEHLDVSYINRVTDVALKRLDIAFSDEQMEPHHFEELLQIVMGLPLLFKDRLIRKFACRVEQNFEAEDVRYFYELSMKHRNFGRDFRNGLKNPSVLDP